LAAHIEERMRWQWGPPVNPLKNKKIRRKNIFMA
jgi:hypothetical protein